MHIGLVGDVMLGRSFNEIFSQDQYHNPWGNTVSVLNSMDVLFGNSEMAITSATRKYPKTFNYRLDPRYLDVLRPPRFTSMSLANNHSLDFYEEGLFDTKFYLNSLGIHSPGAGRDLTEARSPTYFNSNGINFAHISASDHPPEWVAGINKPGINYIDIQQGDYGSLLNQVQQEKQNNRKVIVSLHWGPNYELEVSAEKKRLAYDLSRVDCDIIHGHSAHHLQPIDILGNTVIFYSCGDFIDDYAIDREYRNDLAMIGEVVYNTDGGLSEINIHPTRIDHYLGETGYKFTVNLLDETDPDYTVVETRIST